MKYSNLNPQLNVNFDSTLGLEKPFGQDNVNIDKLDVEYLS